MQHQQRSGRGVIIAADGQTRTHQRQGGRITARVPAGGVSVALDRVSQQTHAVYVTRARSAEDLEVLDEHGKVRVRGRDGSYTLKRIQLSEQELDDYYYGFSNQSLWPLCHSAVSRVIVSDEWYRGYVEVNRRFAQAIQPEIHPPALVWVNDYQLAMVPSFLERRPDVTVASFWHIPWPAPDILRRLPERDEILRSLFRCDMVGFHTEEFARNFLQALEIELGAVVDEADLVARLDGEEVRAAVLPLGIDADAVREAAGCGPDGADASAGGVEDEELARVLERNRIVLGVDRLDYSKGLVPRLMALDRFFDKYPECRGQVAYVGVMSPTREAIPAYQQLKQEVMDLEASINDRYADGDWRPLHLLYEGLPRPDVLRLSSRADVCLVTSVADGMNLVAKEFVVAASCVHNPGMLVLSEFAGASNELDAAIIVNPHDIDQTADAVLRGLQMPASERRSRIQRMARRLDRENVYTWAQTFIREALESEAAAGHQVA